MKLSTRLTAVKEYVPVGAVVADVGADRGELSLCLLEEGIAAKVILSDVSAKSLDRAKALFKDKAAAEKAEFRVGDGFTVLSPGEADYAVLAGMGGGTISEILQKSPAIIGSLQGVILQAMGHSDAVRKTLVSLGFALADETMLVEDGQYYTILHAVPGKAAYDEIELFAGAFLLKKADPTLKKYLQKEKARAAAILSALEKKGEGRERRQELKDALARIEEAERRMEVSS